MSAPVPGIWNLDPGLENKIIFEFQHETKTEENEEKKI